MSQLTFTASCIEHYAEHANRSGTEIYEIFEKNGLLKLLRSDYEDLHGMSFEYLTDFFDEYLGKKKAKV